jgi:hypothetical protein
VPQSALFLALRNCLEQVVKLDKHQYSDPNVVARSSREVRLAWAKSEAAVGRSVEEPFATRFDPSEGCGLLAATLRILRALNALRIQAERGATVAVVESLDALGSSFVASLELLSNWFVDDPTRPVREPRRLFLDAERAPAAIGAPSSIVLHFDEMVNAVNTMSHLASWATSAHSS